MGPWGRVERKGRRVGEGGCRRIWEGGEVGWRGRRDGETEEMGDWMEDERGFLPRLELGFAIAGGMGVWEAREVGMRKPYPGWNFFTIEFSAVLLHASLR